MVSNALYIEEKIRIFWNIVYILNNNKAFKSLKYEIYMVEHNYKLSGTGKIIREATASLRQNRRDLRARLKAGKVSTRFETVRTDYSAEFSLKQGREAGRGLTLFKQEGTLSFSELRRDAAKTADLTRYDAAYSVHQYLNLTGEQLEATREKPPSAGRPYREPSSLDRLGNW